MLSINFILKMFPPIMSDRIFTGHDHYILLYVFDEYFRNQGKRT